MSYPQAKGIGLQGKRTHISTYPQAKGIGMNAISYVLQGLARFTKAFKKVI